jgi:hypothetical protein
MTLFPPRTPRRDEQQQRNQEPDRLKPCYRIEADAVVSADAHETPAQDELQSSAPALNSRLLSAGSERPGRQMFRTPSFV